MPTNSPTREQIINVAHGLPVSVLIKYVNNGVISVQDLERVHLADTKIESIKKALSSKEDEVWDKACTSGLVPDFYAYLRTFPQGVNANTCRQILVSEDDAFWQEVCADGSIEALQQYIEIYKPLDGNHIVECQEMLDDPDWVALKRSPNYAALESYEMSHPGSHAEEIAAMREEMTDEMDWKNAVANSSTEKYQWYIGAHPQGKHVAEAQSLIDASAGHDAFVAEMQGDLNAKTPEDMQIAVNHGIITWDDVTGVYGAERAEAIKNFVEQGPLDVVREVPMKLAPDSTEVYFWGTPSSGKTCALGSLLSGAESEYSLDPQMCQGYNYMTRLKSVFRQRQLCSLPPSTSVDEIQEMIFTVLDSGHNRHKMTFIDLAGEIFRAIYFNLTGMYLGEQHQQALDKVQSFLLDKRNPKIHFFVVEYGAENKAWENILMNDYLTTCSMYIRNNKVLKYSTGVYILVSKCDKIPNAYDPNADLVAEAEQYVRNFSGAFYNNLNEACLDAGIKDFQVIPFSIGEVFASKLCQYDDSFVYDVLNTLLAKTPKLKKGFLSMLRK